MSQRCLITGGAGFIGVNLANHYLAQGKQVTIFDSFQRPGGEVNSRWLRERYGERLQVVSGDVRRLDSAFQDLVESCDLLVHLAGQVAVTTSVADPRTDFEVNALGTLSVLEAVRLSRSKPIVLYSSTNKVYGQLADLTVLDHGTRYTYAELPDGVPESRPLDFYSPYGCSKGAGDQYVLDYARIYGLQTVVFRQSCIYGPHQFGVEDQGWVAWFILRALTDQPVVIYGDGKQVRDVLFIDDLIAAYDAAVARIETTTGQVYNLGGGPSNTLSLLELMGWLEQRLGRPMQHSFDSWRPGDQRVFISDIRRARAHLNWQPGVGPSAGLERLLVWFEQQPELLEASCSSASAAVRG